MDICGGQMAWMKTLLVLTLLRGDFGTPPTPAKELSAAPHCSEDTPTKGA